MGKRGCKSARIGQERMVAVRSTSEGKMGPWQLGESCHVGKRIEDKGTMLYVREIFVKETFE